MKNTIALEKILGFAIRRGNTSLTYYSDCAAVLPDRTLSKLFEELYNLQLAQQQRLLAARDIVRSKSADLRLPVDKISEYLIDFEPIQQMTSLQALSWASIRADTSQKLYKLIGECIEDAELKRLFVSMSRKEETHQRLLEAEYDNLVGMPIKTC
jgi:rubrerythrin